MQSHTLLKPYVLTKFSCLLPFMLHVTSIFNCLPHNLKKWDHVLGYVTPGINTRFHLILGSWWPNMEQKCNKWYIFL
jgi:hypothetical protein